MISRVAVWNRNEFGTELRLPWSVNTDVSRRGQEGAEADGMPHCAYFFLKNAIKAI